MIAYPMDSELTYDDDDYPQFDRAAGTDNLRKVYRTLYGQGVLPSDVDSNQFLVKGGQAGMTVTVEGGLILANGCFGLELERRELEVEESGTKDRIDTVVARLNDNIDTRTIDLYIKKGTPATVPVRPDLTRNDMVTELGIADLYIVKNSTTVAEHRITDTRYEASRCGVMSPLGKIDITSVYNQVQADMAYFKENEQASFEEWFEHIKGQLDEDAAGHLQLEIDNLRQDVEDGFDDFEQKISASVGQNLVPYPYADVSVPRYGIMFTVNNDGSLTVNGRPPEELDFVDFSMGTVDLKADTKYTLQLAINGNENAYEIYMEMDSKTVSIQGNGYTTFTSDQDRTVSLELRIFNGTDLVDDNVRFMLEEGNVAHAYQNPKISNINLDKDLEDVSKLVTDVDVKVTKLQSHIGMIIHSTTLDTLAKVKAIYGGTTWTKIQGRFLLGQSSSYAINSTGGSANAIVPYHRHSVTEKTTTSAGAHTHNYGLGDSIGIPYVSGAAYWGVRGTGGSNVKTSEAGNHSHKLSAHNTEYAGTSGNTTGANMPPYKTVYIWERTA